MEKLIEICGNDLFLAETTPIKGSTLPSDKKAVYGFEDWQNLEKVQDEIGGTPIVLHRKDGWSVWNRGDNAYEPFKIKAENYGDDYNLYDENDMDTYREITLDSLQNCDTIAEMLEVVKKAAKVEELLQTCGDDYKCLVAYGSGEVINTRPMEWHFDTHHYAIGLIDFNEELL